MSLPKIRLEECVRLPDVSSGLWRPDAATLRHLTKSLRLYEGAAVEGLSATEGKIFLMKLVRREGEFFLQATTETENECDGLRIVLLVGLLKQDQFDPLLRAVAELGVDEILPVFCDRSVPRYAPSEIPKKMARWNKILLEETKVSGCVHPPELRTPVHFEAVDWDALPETRYAAMLATGASPISGCCQTAGSLVFAVGPEGDWTDEEAQTLLEKKFAPITLGKRVLRASIAATVGCAWFRLAAVS